MMAVTLALGSCVGPIMGCTGGSTGNASCASGASVACAGPGGCSGYQVCNESGTGFDPCNCSVDAGGDATQVADGNRDSTVTDSGLDVSVSDTGKDASDASTLPDSFTDSSDDTTPDGSGSDGSFESGSIDSSPGTDAVAPDSGLPVGSTDGGVCVVCPAGQKMCIAGQCVSASDPYYGCANGIVAVCSLPHAYATCGTTGQCTIATCRTGFADCNGMAADGCETDVTTTSNCGGCGTGCSGSQVCTPTGCAASCPIGQTNCSGSCADLTASPLHCGSCTSSCPAWGNSFGEATCTGGSCGSTCDPGYPDCATANGCDPTNTACPFGFTKCGSGCVVTSSDPKNCGVCGNTCAEVCQAGQCVTYASLLFTQGNGVQDVAVDGHTVLFTNGGDNSVQAIDVDGGALRTLGTSSSGIARVTGDGTFAYWSVPLGAEIVRAPETGLGVATPIAAASEPFGVAVDTTTVYWADQATKSVMMAPKGGGSSTTLTTLEFSDVPGELAFLNGSLFTDSTAGRVYEVTLGSWTAIPSQGPSFAVGGTFAYSTGQPGNNVSWGDPATGEGGTLPVTNVGLQSVQRWRGRVRCLHQSDPEPERSAGNRHMDDRAHKRYAMGSDHPDCRRALGGYEHSIRHWFRLPVLDVSGPALSGTNAAVKARPEQL